MPEEIVEQIKLTSVSGQWSLTLHKNPEGYVWPSTWWVTGEQVAWTKVDFPGLLPMPIYSKLWWHVWWPITFVLVVENFGVKYEGKQNVKYLVHALTNYYKISIDWAGKLFVVYPFIETTLTGGFILPWMHSKNVAPLPTCLSKTTTTCTILPWTNKVWYKCSKIPHGHL